MNIFNTSANYTFSFFKGSIFPTHTQQQKKILLVASLAIAFLTTCYFLYRHCFKALIIKANDSETKKKFPVIEKVNQFKHIFIQIDGNGTLVIEDTNKDSNEYMLIMSLAKNTVAKWDSENDAMSFKEYVFQVLHPGDKSDLLLKKEREKKIGGFLKWLTDHSHPARDIVFKNYHEIKNKLKNPEPGKVTVFPSFFVMLDKLRDMNIPFTIILRSFGKDLKAIVDAIEGHSSGIKITHWAKFKDASLCIEGKEPLEKVEDIFNHFVTSGGHFAIQDDWHRWNQDGERGRSGKPFFYDDSGKYLGCFCDDNITGKEFDIVQPREISGKNASTKDLYGKLIFEVNTQEAILNDNYYIDIINQVIESSKKV